MMTIGAQIKYRYILMHHACLTSFWIFAFLFRFTYLLWCGFYSVIAAAKCGRLKACTHPASTPGEMNTMEAISREATFEYRVYWNR